MHPNDGRVVSNFIVQALTGEPITVFGDGSQTRSFCYVDDLIEAMVLFMAADDAFGDRSISVILRKPRCSSSRARSSRHSRARVRRCALRAAADGRPQAALIRTSIWRGSSLGWTPVVPLKEGLARYHRLVSRHCFRVGTPRHRPPVEGHRNYVRIGAGAGYFAASVTRGVLGRPLVTTHGVSGAVGRAGTRAARLLGFASAPALTPHSAPVRASARSAP